MSLKLEVKIDVPESIRRGKPSREWAVLVVDDAALAALPDADRALVASYLSTSGSHPDTGADAHLTRPTHSNSPPTLPEATLAGVMEGVRADVARAEEEKRKKADAANAEAMEKRERTLAVLRDRKTETVKRHVFIFADDGAAVVKEEWSQVPGSKEAGCGRAEYTAVRPNWPYYGDDSVKQSPEAVAWTAELEAANATARGEAERRAEKDRLGKEKAAEIRAAAEEKAAAERDEWIAANGSRRLNRMLEEDMERDAAYRDERLAAERPGWAWSKVTDGDHDDPRNPPEEAFDLLDAARAVEPDAELKYWTIDREEDKDADDEDESDGKYAWAGYVAVAEFLGLEIVSGVPAQYAGK